MPAPRESSAPSSDDAVDGASSPVYVLRVTLKGLDPPVWRLLEVPGTSTLLGLHRVLQIAMGWEDYHLFRFETGGLEYGIEDEGGFLEMEDAGRVRLMELAQRKGERILYEYDLGDGWMHEVVVECISQAGANAPAPRVLDGGRACPPEDSGGVYGYADLLEALADPEHEEHEAWRTWVEEDFDPEHWDPEEVQRRLDLVAGGEGEALPPEVEDLLDGLGAAMTLAGEDLQLTEPVILYAIVILGLSAERDPDALLRSRKPEIWAAAALHAASLTVVGHGPGHSTVDEIARRWGVSSASVASRSLAMREDVDLASDLALPALFGDLRVVIETPPSLPELGGRTDSLAVLDVAGTRADLDEPIKLADLARRFGLAPGEAQALRAALERGVAAWDAEHARPDRFDDVSTDQRSLEERLGGFSLLGYAACQALRSPGVPAASKDVLARHLLALLAAGTPPPGALLAVARLAARGILTGPPLRAALRLAAACQGTAEGLEAEELRPLWRALALAGGGSEESGHGVEALFWLVSATAASSRGELSAAIVAAVAHDADLHEETRSEFAARLSDMDAELMYGRPPTPAVRRAALVGGAALRSRPEQEVRALLDRAIEGKDIPMGIAAATLLQSHGAELPKEEVDALVRRGLGAWNGEIRRAFFRAGVLHLGGDARDWAPNEAVAEARSKWRRSDEGQGSLF